MSEFLFQYYPVHPTTWAYLSSLLMIGLFVKFGRFWSVRNLDLGLLIALAPGLLLVYFGEKQLQQTQADFNREPVAAARETDSSDLIADAGGESQVGDPAAEPIEFRATELAQSDPTSTDLPEVGTEEIDGPDDFADHEAADGVSNDALAVAIPTAAAAVDPDKLLSAERARSDPGYQEIAVEEQQSETATVPLPPDDGIRLKRFGFIWLLSASGLLLLRLLLDPAMVRRPLLEPNLSTGGLIFIGCSLFLFLMANVVSTSVTEKDLKGPRGADRLLAAVSDEEANAGDSESEPTVAAGDDSTSPAAEWNGPGNAVLYLLPNLVTMPQLWSGEVKRTEGGYTRLAKTMAILSHLAVVIGIVAIGYRHFGNIQTGIGAATLYLMLPYTAQMTGRVDHILPAALLVWAVLCYRRPLPAGMFIGLAIGVAYYPLFLLPLWISFYRQRGLMRFVSGVVSMLCVVAMSMIFVSNDLAAFGFNIRRMFGLRLPEMENLGGMWGLGWEPLYRIPVLAAFVALSGTLAIWPIRKNLGTLLSCSAALMIATQFWHGDGGGLYIAWYVPLTLLTIFRPNLEDRVALTVLGAGWLPRRFKSTTKRIDIAA